MDDAMDAIPVLVSERELSAMQESDLGIRASEESREIEPMSTEWTDEKHNLYLNSIEASFISQLYHSNYCSNDLLHLLPIMEKDKPLTSRTNKPSSGQFKVLRDGFWTNPSFEGVRDGVDVENGTRSLATNPWIQHFRSPLICMDQMVKSSEEAGATHTTSKVMNYGSERHTEELVTANLPRATCSQMYFRDSIGSNREVSDQNFVDKSSGVKLSGSSKRKRPRTRDSPAAKDA
ncbi:cold-regulated protein 27-like isoform X2 [Typha latifolia]|uniref:cold-regulated protein 27-like isoform X2 n=1 Tax=Typha latifolia TaxID=4733 RepID=UPI003C2C9E33